MTYFREEQRFRQPWLMGLMGVAVAGWFFALYMARLNARPPLISLLPLAIWGWLLAMRLITEVRPEGMYIRFQYLWPERTIPYEQIVKVESQRYRPILQYGGWGVRGMFPVRAFNVSGNRGVLLTLSNGRTLMIGSQRADQLAQALQSRLRESDRPRPL